MLDRHPRARRATLAVVGALLSISLATTVASAQDDTVVISSTLEPASLEVAPGTTVTWRNDDAGRHRIRSREGPEDFDSGNLEPGERFTFTFALEGTYPYVDERDDENPAYFGTIVVTTAPPEGSTSGALATSGDITIGDRVFIPPTIEVATGSTVAFTNADGEGHTATASDGSFDSGILQPGDSHSETFDLAGSFPFFCAIHPDMQGSITVTDPAAGASPATDPASPSSSPAPPGSASPSGPAATSPEASASLAPDVGATTSIAVSIVDRSFDPPDVEVRVGGAVDWTNDDVDGHTVTAQDGSLDSGIIAPGEAFSSTFDTAGTFDYVCAIHPDMTGTVVVTDGAASVGSGPSASPYAASG